MEQNSQKYGLARLVLEPGGRFLELDRSRAEELVAAKLFVVEILSLEEKYDLLVSNYLEFERTLNSIATDFMIRPHYDYHSFNDERVTINRIVVNLLGACRLYLDHGDYHLSVVDAKVVGVKDEFNLQRNQAYDANAEYRICEGLRNHTQHRGFPIGNVQWGGGWVERRPGVKALLQTVEPRIDVLAMRDSPKTKKIVLEDLDHLGKETNVRPILRKYISLISSIHHFVRGRIDTDLKAAETLLQQAIDDFKVGLPEKESIVGLHVVKVAPDGKREGMTAIFPELLERRQMLADRNPYLKGLARWHVSSEPRS